MDANFKTKKVFIKTPVKNIVLPATVFCDENDNGRCSVFLDDYTGVLAQGETQEEAISAITRLIPHAIESGVISVGQIDMPRRKILGTMAQIIDDFLNAGDKASRAEAAKNGREFYEYFYGVPYKNRNER